MGATVAGRRLSHRWADFWGSHIAQDDRMPLAGVVTRHVRRKGGLAHTPLGIGNNNHWHVDLLAKKITNKNRF